MKKSVPSDAEEWRIVKGFEMYSVSNFGRVKSTHKGKEIVLKQMDHYRGYKVVYLYSSDFKNKKHFLHRLVAEAFIPNPESKPFVNHIDCNKQNNFLSNLEWMTESENTKYYYATREEKASDGHEF